MVPQREGGAVPTEQSADGARVTRIFALRLACHLMRCCRRLYVGGAEYVPPAGAALLIANHASAFDPLVLQMTQKRTLCCVVGSDAMKGSLPRVLCALFRIRTLTFGEDEQNAQATLQTARELLDAGQLVCLFPERQISRTGNLLPFRSWTPLIAPDAVFPIIPVYIGWSQGECPARPCIPWSRPWPPARYGTLVVLFGHPLSHTSSVSTVRQAMSELAGRVFELRKHRGRSLSQYFVHAARRWWFRPAVADSTGREMSYGQALTGAYLLAAEIERLDPRGHAVGILLPPSVGGAIANTAVTLAGRVAVNLNFTAPRQDLLACIRRCDARLILSSRTFLAKLNMDEPPPGTVYLETILGGISVLRKAAAAVKAAFWPVARLTFERQPGPNDVATIIFSSGTTGAPKGVMLSHHNIISNIEGFCRVLRFDATDRMCGALPFFHSFGYTCTLWCPLLRGFMVTYHPNPLDGAKIAELVRTRRLTILLGTPTFLFTYLRRAAREDFASLRLVVAGAEKLRENVAHAFEEKFGIRPLEGYGTTEIAPVGAVNVPDVRMGDKWQVGTKPGSVGQPIPGVTMRVVHPVTGKPVAENEEGLLQVKGPNVMLGYLKDEAGTRAVLKDGWYDTGDMARIDEDGFVFLTGRLARFSKIAGEMVPHQAVENALLKALGALDQVVAVTSIEDERKGEQLVVLFTPEAGDTERLWQIIRKSEFPNLWKPPRENLINVAALPLLASGKLDLQQLRKLARQEMAKRCLKAREDEHDD